jgi:hypothetical protein
MSPMIILSPRLALFLGAICHRHLRLPQYEADANSPTAVGLVLSQYIGQCCQLIDILI